jgi:hypothetical protein
MPRLSGLTLHQLRTFKMFNKNQTQSSCVADVSYDPETLDMTVQFLQRGTYVYHDVPVDEYVDFETASSQGKYFNFYIKDRYAFDRIA